MRILAVDTASGSGSAAVLDEDSLLAEIISVRRETHSRYLMGIIDQTLELAGLKLAEIDGFAVTAGPGSFTGLRIGISTVKGLAWAMNKPVIGVSSLEGLALQAAPWSHLICAMLDARNQEVYCGRYRFSEGRLQSVIEDQPLPLPAAIEGISGPCVFIGDGALRYRERIVQQLGELAVFVLPFQHSLHAASVCHIGRERFLENRIDTAATLAPRYLRKSVVEMK